MKKYIILGLLGTFGLVMLVWVGTHSYINITVANAADGGELTYILTNQTGDITSYTTTETSLKKLVSKGRYQVKVQQAGTSYLAFPETGAFLATSDVSASLQAEAGRRFVGDNPGPCMNYIGDRLYSGECNDSIEDLKEHLPATAKSPTYVNEVRTNDMFGISRGIVTTKAGTTWALLLQENEEGPPSHYLLQIRPDLSVESRRKVAVPDSNTPYTMRPYKDGVVIYNYSYGHVQYISAFNAPGVNIELEPAKTEDLVPLRATISQEAITMVYSEEGVGDSLLDADARNRDEITQTSRPTPGKTEVVVYKDTSQRHFTFDTIYSAAMACGTNKLCLVHEPGLDVYDVSGDEPEYRFGVPGISAIEESGDTVLAFNDNEIISLDIDSEEGFSEYNLLGYRFCGYQPSPSGYVLCLVSDKGNKTALLIDSQTKDSEAIDKKILELEQVSVLTKVSINGRFIHIAPDYGRLVYNPTTNTNGNDPRKVESVNKSIDAAIAKIGIDREAYTIVNTGQPSR